MEPEIARRCKSCGAAIRARSAFCPQCGVAQVEGGREGAPASSPAAAPPEAPQRKTADPRPGTETIASAAQAEAPLKTDAARRVETHAPESVRSTDAAAAGTLPVVNQPHTSAAAPATGPADTATAKRQRVTAVNSSTRGVADDGVRHRADKLRRASNVVLDEAAADPSLRFVLVATALIIISLLLLLLARII